MVSKRYDLEDDTVSKIHAIKKAKGLKSEKEVLVQAIEQFALSEMIEHESAEYKMLDKMNTIKNEIEQMKKKMNHIDHCVSVNSLLLTADFEIKKHPKAIVNRDIFESDYYTSARKEITKLIRERDSFRRKGQSKNIEDTLEQNNDDGLIMENEKKSDKIDDDWLNV
ncbi:hypothetical protein [Salinicoccus kekensis]|uniref:Uncharacterized protein n=1 Tax=Salinicoccus kekensis TaxID=714307 RepID=A0A285UTI8_9STAP|nr:hypothetical protein [Salinicoccus kekensis]SOC45129.1 hypothetical protein SAMN05878391_2622 [Salinicoccus kekensis]